MQSSTDDLTAARTQPEYSWVREADAVLQPMRDARDGIEVLKGKTEFWREWTFNAEAEWRKLLKKQPQDDATKILKTGLVDFQAAVDKLTKEITLYKGMHQARLAAGKTGK